MDMPKTRGKPIIMEKRSILLLKSCPEITSLVSYNEIASYLRLHPLKSVNARVADVPWISLCRFRRIAGYATESKSDRQGAAARRMVFLFKSKFLNII